MAKKIAIFICYILLVIFAADYGLYRLYVYRFFPSKIGKDIDSWSVDRSKDPLWYLTVPDADRKSSFMKFLYPKKPGVMRIGCFGDSYTYGEEVLGNYDYASFLDKKLKGGGYPNIEVLNFGIPWSGFHQEAMLWECLNKWINLDYIIIGPSAFWPDRENTFNHYLWERVYTDPSVLRRRGGTSAPFNLSEFYAFHGRYVINDGIPEMYFPEGNTLEERTMDYWGFFPPFLYLAYDKNPPLFLAAPLYLLSNHRLTIANPFYYDKRGNRESFDIYHALLKRMAHSAKQVVVAHFDDKRFDPQNIRDIKVSDIDNLAVIYLPLLKNFPYKEPRGHYSSFGNDFYSGIIYDCLRGLTKSRQPVIVTFDLPADTSGTKLPKRFLSDYSEIAFSVDGMRILTVFVGYEAVVNPVVFKTLSARSLVAIKNKDTSVMDALFFPGDMPLEEGGALELRLTGGFNKADKFIIGKVKLFNPGLNLGVVDINSEDIKVQLDLHHKILLAGMRRYTPLGRLFFRAHKAEIFLNGKPVMVSSGKDKAGVFSMHPPEGSTALSILMPGDCYADIRAIPDKGTIFFLLADKAGKTFKIPVAGWKKEIVEFPFSRPAKNIIK